MELSDRVGVSMPRNFENLERPNKSETSPPKRPVSDATKKALGAAAVKGAQK